MSDPLHLAVVLASTRDPRLGSTVATWFVTEAATLPNVTCELIDLKDYTFPADMSASDDVARFGAAIDAADAVVIVTPEYNHSFPGMLKIAIDSLKAQWVAKPVGFVSYGGVSAGLRAVEALRLVFAELHTLTVRDAVCFQFAWQAFDDAGQPKQASFAHDGTVKMVEQLRWWSAHTRGARATYPG